MRFYFHESPESEFDNAIAYYENCRTGLGLEFAQEIYSAIERINEFPDAWSLMSKIDIPQDRQEGGYEYAGIFESPFPATGDFRSQGAV